eukprot:TRINITY_DN27400_c0_g1_i2.p1 TRINITY_DN27400_c0_g1~~TRINITY_DN27400_c0_g1_i2.p1  ORF type:complete len:100 (+),score=5.88 TRINITY_DN27400_c0_g1_i2:80-379(+)
MNLPPIPLIAIFFHHNRPPETDSSTSLQSYFPSKASFICFLGILYPNLLLALMYIVQTDAQSTKWYFLSALLPCHRKPLCNICILLITELGILESTRNR